MTIYYVTSLFRELMLDYIRSGKDTYFDLVVVNDDPNSGSEDRLSSCAAVT